MPAEILSTALFRETRGFGFFRVLSGRNAPFYVDVLDALERESSEQAEGMAREEVILIIIETLERHPGFEFDPDAEGADAATQSADIRDRARILLEYLLKCRWLDEPPRRDWRRKIHFDAHGATLLASLRKIAWPDAAVFTDKITGVCAMLADEVELLDHPWQAVENCLSTVREGINELRAMQKSVQRFTRRQMEEETLQGNLTVVFDDYSEQMSRSCYASLVRARLPLRLPEAVQRIGTRLTANAKTLADMQTEVLRRHPEMSADTARTMVTETLDELTNLLDRVLPMADEIDRRTADFTRRSLARFRYLQDVSGERRSDLKSFFESVNRHIAGKRLTQLAGSLPDLPDLRIPAVKLPAGLDSLTTPPLRRTPIEQDAFDDTVDDSDRQAGLRDMEQALRESLTVQRANAFVRSLPGGKGERITSAQISLASTSGFTDLISVLLHAEAADARFTLEVERVAFETNTPPLDALDGCSVERFAIIKK